MVPAAGGGAAAVQPGRLELRGAGRAAPGIGLSPYGWGPGLLEGPIIEAVDPRWLCTPAPYGPLPLLGGEFAASAPADPWLLVIAHRLLAARSGWSCWPGRCPGWRGGPGATRPSSRRWCLPSPLMLAHGVGGLHNDLLMVGLWPRSLVVARAARLGRAARCSAGSRPR